jgi:hypothetical protein
MGFIKAAESAGGSVESDAWEDFYTVPSNTRDTDAIVRAVQVKKNNGRGDDTHGSVAIITNGSKIIGTRRLYLA